MKANRLTTMALLLGVCIVAAGVGRAGQSGNLPTIPVGFDAYRMWDHWSHQRIGARAYMRSTYDRRGGNETADASHFLYQLSDDFNVTLDVQGPGVLYFVRYNHWHGSPWHYEVDGTDHIVKETSTATPNDPVAGSTFIPENLFPNPLTWTWSRTKGANLMWVPIPFEERFRMAYGRTHYGTGYYIWHHYVSGVPLSQPIETWGATPPAPAVLELLRRSGTDIAPRANTVEGERLGVERVRGRLALGEDEESTFATVRQAPAMIRALKISAPRKEAINFGRARLRVTWDGREHPSIDAPLALFFGTGTLYNREGKEYLVKAFPMNVRFDDERVYLACYFPMPFFRSAKFELINESGEHLSNIEWSVRHHPYEGPREHVAYFHATYRDHGDPKLGHDLVWLDTREVEGGGPWSGHFVGTSYIFTHNAYLPTLEGDPRFFFDGSQTPQAYGTGSEEWGGGGDYWGGRSMTLPLAGHPVGVPRANEAKRPEGLVHSAYRFLLADLMPFGRRAVIRFEHGGENQSREHYKTVTYWYGVPSPSLVKTDSLDIGDPTSESAHEYSSPDAEEPYELTSRYEWGVDHVTIGGASGPRAESSSWAEYVFDADADKIYTIWVRGRSSGDIRSDATWFQFDKTIGTGTLGSDYDHGKGFGNWRDAVGAGEWAWSSALPDVSPQTVRFEESGRHRLRIQTRHGPHVLDQIWLSASQTTRPTFSHAVKADLFDDGALGEIDEIVLEAEDANKVVGDYTRGQADDASGGRVLHVSEAETIRKEIYPATTKTGRVTTGSSSFTLQLRPDNHGVLLRRTLDYKYPSQRATVYVADAGAGDASSEWELAGTWYVAGSNTCVYSYPRDELGETEHHVQTSNRRFRDDEFLISRDLTRGRDAIRVRVDFAPVRIPLFPGRPLDELGWSAIKYTAYCYVTPEF